jgi:hypothetical protein
MSEEAFRPELVTPIRHNKPKPQPHDENNYHNIPEIFQLPRDVFVDLYTKAHLFEQLHPDLLSSPQDASGTPGISGNKCLFPFPCVFFLH